MHTGAMSRGHSYRNGQWIDAAELSVPIDDLGFEMGVTVVERLRTFSGAPYRTDEHVARLRRSLQIVGWNAEALANEASEAIREFAHRNAAYMAPGDDWAIVAFVTPGKVYDGSEARLCVHGFPLP
ncbi:MAG: aminotransferase class IV, partial [Planctomycetota bacterium]